MTGECMSTFLCDTIPVHTSHLSIHLCSLELTNVLHTCQMIQCTQNSPKPQSYYAQLDQLS